MSGFDINVWYSNTHLTVAQAVEIRRHVGTDWVIFAHDPRVDSFLTELRRRYPDFTIGDAAQHAQWGPFDPFLQSVDDPKRPPLTAPRIFRFKRAVREAFGMEGFLNRGLFTSLSILWENATEVFPYLRSLAKKHQMTVLDEADDLQQPQTTTMAVPAIFRLSLTLHIAGKSFPSYKPRMTRRRA